MKGFSFWCMFICIAKDTEVVQFVHLYYFKGNKMRICTDIYMFLNAYLYSRETLV
jgi:hypothetical protein